MQQQGHLDPLYRSSVPADAVAASLRRLAEIAAQLPSPAPLVAAAQRTPWTKLVDRSALWFRRRLPLVHWIGAASFALAFFLYSHIVGQTVRLVRAGDRHWPDLPAPCVLALWHGQAPSFLCAVAGHKPKIPMMIMVASDPRGDSLALLCRFLGFRVVRGDAGHGGWKALLQMSAEMEQGIAAVLTPDGGGPARFAKPGALVLSAAAGVPLFAVGADCSLGWTEKNKWDTARNPLPFARIAIAVSGPLTIPPIASSAVLESARSMLEEELDSAAAQARAALVVR